MHGKIQAGQLPNGAQIASFFAKMGGALSQTYGSRLALILAH